MNTKKQKQFVEFVHEARKNKRKWEDICNEVNSSDLLGRTYKMRSIKAIFKKLDSKNKQLGITHLDQDAIVQTIDGFRRSGNTWEQVAKKMAKLGVKNSLKQCSYTGMGIKAVYDRLVRNSNPPVDAPKKVEKTNVECIAETTEVLMKIAKDLNEFLIVEKKKSQEKDDEILKTMMILEKFPELKTMNDGQIEKLRMVAKVVQ